MEKTDMIKSMTDLLWNALDQRARKNVANNNYVVLMSLVRKALSGNSNVDPEKFTDYFDVNVIDTSGPDAFVDSLARELSKYVDNNDGDNDRFSTYIASVISRANELLSALESEELSNEDIEAIRSEIMDLIDVLKSFGEDRIAMQIRNRLDNALSRPVDSKVVDISEILSPMSPTRATKVVESHETKVVDTGGVRLMAYDKQHVEKMRKWAREKARVNEMVRQARLEAQRAAANVDWDEWIKQFKNPNAEDWFVILQPVRPGEKRGNQARKAEGKKTETRKTETKRVVGSKKLNEGGRTGSTKELVKKPPRPSVGKIIRRVFKILRFIMLG